MRLDVGSSDYVLPECNVLWERQVKLDYHVGELSPLVAVCQQILEPYVYFLLDPLERVLAVWNVGAHGIEVYCGLQILSDDCDKQKGNK